jgi:hypothetical protein
VNGVSFAREAGAFLVNPIRGFNRVVTGDATEVQGNPADPQDWRPDFQLLVRAGARVIGEGESISQNTNTYGFLEATLSYGDAWGDNRRPYDRFDTSMQINVGDKTRVGRLLIRGDLFSKLVGKNHSLALQQDFDYVDNDYGPGLGASVELYLLRRERLLASFRYRYSYLSVSNGSVYSGERNGYNLGLDASHNMQRYSRPAAGPPHDHPEEPRGAGQPDLDLHAMSR